MGWLYGFATPKKHMKKWTVYNRQLHDVFFSFFFEKKAHIFSFCFDPHLSTSYTVAWSWLSFARSPAMHHSVYWSFDRDTVYPHHTHTHTHHPLFTTTLPSPQGRYLQCPAEGKRRDVPRLLAFLLFVVALFLPFGDHWRHLNTLLLPLFECLRVHMRLGCLGR